MDELASTDDRIAVQDKKVSELVRSLLVYKLCSFQSLVNFAPNLIELAKRLHLSWFAYWTIKKTFFAQFCGGQTAEECIETMNRLKSEGIGCILDYSVEADVENSKGSSDPESDEFRKCFNEKADYVTDMMLKCIDTAATHPNSFIALKITGITNPLMLERLSTILVTLYNQFRRHDNDKDGIISRSDLLNIIKEVSGISDKAAEKLLDEFHIPNVQTIDMVQFQDIFSIDSPKMRHFFSSLPNERLTSYDIADYDKLMARLDRLFTVARKSNVRVMVDAEQLRFQPAIDSIAMRLSCEYNKMHGSPYGPIVFNTYQMYLKDARERLELHYEISQRQGFAFAGKLVRGAYMTSERERAKALGYDDPIQDTIESTHDAYNSAVEFLIRKQSEIQMTMGAKLGLRNSPLLLMIASHNVDSMIKACKLMEELNVSSDSGVIFFGQLFGMRDHVSFTLKRHGYEVYKYVPYGKLEEVIPYLIRRAQENSSVLNATDNEQSILWNELGTSRVKRKKSHGVLKNRGIDPIQYISLMEINRDLELIIVVII
ncbi:7552_t:CDS:2 [Paraglomus occultum]|uniref:Proline dehydrogenase n=1 Tax=Paraglomus occultum TaxID=144539 RepID=A0A9N9BZ59_9GLOM|nr:7552_t:CDS:2 [Paraglomus occultum]